MITFALSLSGLILLARFSFQFGQVFQLWGRVLASLPTYLAKPLGDCLFCFGFWLSVVSVLFFGQGWQVIGITQLILFIYAEIKNLSDILQRKNEV